MNTNVAVVAPNGPILGRRTSVPLLLALLSCAPGGTPGPSGTDPPSKPDRHSSGVADDSPLGGDSDSEVDDHLPLDGMPRIHVRWDEACAVGQSGLITCWGGNADKRPDTHTGYTPQVTEDVPDEVVSSVAVASKGVAFGADGTLVVDWGDNFAWDDAWLQALGDARAWQQVDTGRRDGDWCSVASDGTAYCIGVPLQGDGWSWASAGWGYAVCAIHTTNGLQCWEGPEAHGVDRFGSIPTDHPDAVAVDVGNWCTCVITRDRGVACDGDHCAGHPPSGLENVRRLVIDSAQACAIDDDDLLTCWGLDPAPPARAATLLVRDVSVSGNTACLITYDDELLCWGSDDYGVATPPPYAR